MVAILLAERTVSVPVLHPEEGSGEGGYFAESHKNGVVYLSFGRQQESEEKQRQARQ